MSKRINPAEEKLTSTEVDWLIQQNSLSLLQDTTQGPHGWNAISAADFGPEHDFELENHITLWIFTPVSNAALQWCYAKLPADAPRWGAKGYVIEARFIEQIVAGARNDNLMTPEDYERAMEESHAAAHQGENL